MGKLSGLTMETPDRAFWMPDPGVTPAFDVSPPNVSRMKVEMPSCNLRFIALVTGLPSVFIGFRITCFSASGFVVVSIVKEADIKCGVVLDYIPTFSIGTCIFAPCFGVFESFTY